MYRVYVSGRLKDELQLKQLRDYLWVCINASEYYKKKEPHITIVPAFNVKDDDIDDVKDVIRNIRFDGESVAINTLSVYENIHKPYVVQLDIEYSIESKIDALISQLSKYATNGIKYPNDPHITLFKTQGWWDTIPLDKRRRLQKEISSTTGILDTEISSIKIEVR